MSTEWKPGDRVQVPPATVVENLSHGWAILRFDGVNSPQQAIAGKVLAAAERLPPQFGVGDEVTWSMWLYRISSIDGDFAVLRGINDSDDTVTPQIAPLSELRLPHD